MIDFVRLHLYRLRKAQEHINPGRLRARLAAVLIWWLAPLALATALAGFMRLDQLWVTAFDLGCLIWSARLSVANYRRAVNTLRTVNGRGLTRPKEWSDLGGELATAVSVLVVAVILMLRADGWRPW